MPAKSQDRAGQVDWPAAGVMNPDSESCVRFTGVHRDLERDGAQPRRAHGKRSRSHRRGVRCRLTRCGSLRSTDGEPRGLDTTRGRVGRDDGGARHVAAKYTGMNWRDRIAAGPALVLDGATGTELERRGLRTSLPLWSAHALLDDPQTVQQVHADYAEAGAELLTANTFRTQRRSLARVGLGDRAAELTTLAVTLARNAGGHRTAVLGSSPPLEDCFSPERVPDDATLAREHGEHAHNLAAAGADAILAETMNTTREAVAAARAGVEAGLPVLVSFTCWQGAHLLSGETLDTAIEAVRASEPIAVLVNCLPPGNVAACLPPLTRSRLPFGIYPNLGAPSDTPDDEAVTAHTDDHTPAELARRAQEWLAAGARIIGGCCGTTPAHVAALTQLERNGADLSRKNPA